MKFINSISFVEATKQNFDDELQLYDPQWALPASENAKNYIL